MKLTKKILSLVLCIIMVMTSLSLAMTAFAADDKCDCGVSPVVYIKGRTNIYKDPSLGTDSENMAESNFSGLKDKIPELAFNIVTTLGAGFPTEDWDAYCDAIFEAVAPVYDQYKLSNEGTINNKSGISPDYQIDNLISRLPTHEGGIRENHTRYAYDWAQFTQFQYDIRLDPRDNADDLKRYIDAVKKESGHDKVKIICRCEGNVIVNAYLAKYGHSDIEGLVMYNSIAMGAEIADDMYTDNVRLDPEAMNRFINTFLDASPVLDLVKATVNLLAFNGLLGDGLEFVEDGYYDISKNIMPRLIREIFGTCPGWWGMISPDVFDKAVDFVLESDNEDGKYDVLIQKLTEYNEIKKLAPGLLKAAQQDGVKVYILAKYGDQMYPVIESYDALGDGVVSLYKQTFCGATTSKISAKLSDDYIAQRVEEGFGKYISADKMVDGSTALFADYTWYVKELRHDNYPWSTDFFMLDLLNSDTYVNATEEFKGKYGTYSQYMLFEEYIGEIYNMPDENIGILHPMTDENKDETKDTTNTTSRFAVIIKWFTALFNFIASLFKK
jgi:hypothetical protein